MLTGALPALASTGARCREISMLPGRSARRPAESARDRATRREHGVRLVVTDDRTWPGYGHGAFGETFDRALADWIAIELRRVATVTVPAHDTSKESRRSELFVWMRRDHEEGRGHRRGRLHRLAPVRAAARGRIRGRRGRRPLVRLGRERRSRSSTTRGSRSRCSTARGGASCAVRSTAATRSRTSPRRRSRASAGRSRRSR